MFSCVNTGFVPSLCALRIVPSQLCLEKCALRIVPREMCIENCASLDMYFKCVCDVCLFCGHMFGADTRDSPF